MDVYSWMLLNRNNLINMEEYKRFKTLDDLNLGFRRRLRSLASPPNQLNCRRLEVIWNVQLQTMTESLGRSDMTMVDGWTCRSTIKERNVRVPLTHLPGLRALRRPHPSRVASHTSPYGTSKTFTAANLEPLNTPTNPAPLGDLDSHQRPFTIVVNQI